ncbi:MAG: class I SAM-dependent methyltransferase [Bacteroidales bacterium]
MIGLSEALKIKYDNYYTDKTESWRKLGALQKAQNIIDITEGLSFKNVIEVGAGDGNIIYYLNQKKYCNNYTAVEISSSAIEQIKKKNIAEITEIRQFNGYDLPYNNNQFDLCICSHVIEHVEYPRKLLKEIKRISSNQVFEVPIDFSLNVDKKFEHYNSYGHINIYSPSLFNFLLKSVGFEIRRSKSSLYSNKILFHKIKFPSLKYIKILAKIVLWKAFPVLINIKPNSYTVLTK